MRKVCRCKALEEYVRDCQSRDRSLHLEDWRSLHHCGKLPVPLARSDHSHHVQLLCVHRASSITIVTITSANTPAPASGTRLPVLQSTVEFASLVASVRMVW